MTLLGSSPFYGKQVLVYQSLVAAEDKPGLVAQYFEPIVMGKTVLDLGCGTGKYVTIFSKLAKEVIGIEPSEELFALAKQTTPSTVTLIHGSGEHMPLPDACVDVVFASWVIGSISDEAIRKKVIAEGLRVLKPDGVFWLVENDEGGEFELLRGRVPGPENPTRKLNTWLTTEMGFVVKTRLESWFEFASIKEAQAITKAIWGNPFSALHSAKIVHSIVVMAQSKSP